MQEIPEIVGAHTNLSGYKIGDYICSKKLGEGSFACVYKGFNQKNEDQVVAIKVTDKSKYRGGGGEKFLKLLDAEAKAMSVCKSDHIVRCYKQYVTKKYVIFILEYCNNESLFDEIQKRKKIPEAEAKRILKQLIIAFAEMHKNNIIHRDLKPENVFKHNEKYKIGDFGFCKIFQSLNDLTRTPLGSLVSMAPEVIDSQPYGIKADLWSLGTVYYEMLYGNPPYISSSYTGMRRVINRNDIMIDGISKQSVDFFKKVFVADPQQRLSWTQLYSIALFRSPSMVMFQNHQDDPDLDEARETHMMIEEQERKLNYKNAEDHLKQTLLLPAISTIQQLADEYDHIRQSEKEQIMKKEEKMTEKQHQMMRYRDELNFEMQKSIFIFNEIYKPLTVLKLNKERKLVEYRFLILTRCFYIMSPLNFALKRETNIFKWKYYQQFLKDSNHKSFLKDFSIHYDEIRKAKDKESDELSTIEGEKIEQLKDFFRKSIFSRSHFKEENNFINGLQGQDYTKEQHVDFIVQNYQKIVNQIMTSSYGKNKNQLGRTYRAIEYFTKIALAEYLKGQGKDTLRQGYDHLKIEYENV